MHQTIPEGPQFPRLKDLNENDEEKRVKRDEINAY